MLAARSRTERLAFLALLAMTAAWGSTFFLIKDLVTRMPVADLLAIRFAIASVALGLIAAHRIHLSRPVVIYGVLLGLLYGSAQILQTAGLSHTSASVSGFVTGLYVVATPLLTAIILRRRIPPLTWVAAVLATLGLGVLALRGVSIGYGELLTLISAVIYAGHIVALGRFSSPETTLSLSLVQLSMITLLTAVAALWPTAGSAPGIQLPGSLHDWLVVLYLALIASALTMVLQTWAQAHIEPSRAAVIMAMEPVWAAAFAVALGGESITARMIIGGLAIVSAMYLVERPQRRRTEPTATKEYVI
ncbi:MAG TPA: DMT family transporter [Propionibacteriaceae bacterium]|jgi:drug/metabolite transporter (DMT)-like permease|nr:DMT family transporter [Propionibacteriaceae bacterium]